jgi:small subunit ribosomal protein S17
VNRGQRKVVVGVVTSDKMAKTVTVESERRYKHPRYEKYLRTVTRYKVHDERGEAKAGDRVRIMETRPLSKTKRWRLVEVVGHARGVEQS